jgi:inner membrane protein
MPTVISHTVVALSAGKAFAPKDVPVQFWLLAVICSSIPDADVIGFSFGIQYSDFWGHRGFFHSISFALLLSIFIVVVFFHTEKIFSNRWIFYLVFFFLLSASHGILDACTNGGLGIALFSPFDNSRYFFPNTPIMVSPIGIQGFLSHWGLLVIKSEALWIWLPSLALVSVSKLIRVLS